MYTTEPGVQCYTGCDTVPHSEGKQGAVYEKFCSICLETQHYPDSVNKVYISNVLLVLQNKLVYLIKLDVSSDLLSTKM